MPFVVGVGNALAFVVENVVECVRLPRCVYCCGMWLLAPLWDECGMWLLAPFVWGMGNVMDWGMGVNGGTFG